MVGDLSQIMQGAKNAVGNFTDKAASSVTAETKSALGNLGNLVGESEQAINHLTTKLTQSIGGLNEATGKLKTSVLETTSGAVSTITEATNRAANTVKITTEQATGALNDAANIAVHQLNDATSYMTQTAEKTTFALDETLQKAEHLSGGISHSVQDLVVTSTQFWMAEHPMVSWSIAHPLWTITLMLLTLFLGWNLFGAIAQLAQQALLSMLQAPLKLIQSLSKSAFQAIKRTDSLQLDKLDSQQNRQKRLAEILNRLEILRQEQEALMKEMHSILLPKS